VFQDHPRRAVLTGAPPRSTTLAESPRPKRRSILSARPRGSALSTPAAPVVREPGTLPQGGSAARA
jgi:hypothetical protein